MTVALYKEALGGNVSAIREINKFIDADETPEEKTEDLSKLVLKEEKKIVESLPGIRKDILNANKDFIHQLAFQSVTLKKLSEDIAKNGVKEKYKNGANQWGYKDRTEVRTYNNMFKNYQSAMKQLNDLIINSGSGYDDGFDEFGEEQ